MSRVQQFTCEDGVRIEEIDDALANFPGLTAARESIVERICLDTFDRRLERRGFVLQVDREGAIHALNVRSLDGRCECASSREERPPGRPDDVSDPRLRRLLRTAIGPRRLLPWLTVSVRRSARGCLDDDLKTFATVALEQVENGAAGESLPVLVSLTAKLGYDDEAAAFAERLAARLPLRAQTRDQALLLDDALGTPRAAYHAKPDIALEPDTPARRAVADALLVYFAVMRANEAGVIEDLDPEFLHDFRVAARRSRTLLNAFAALFDPRDVKKLRRDFAWISRATGPLRDLDVLQMDLERSAAKRAEEDLASLISFVSGLRTAEHRKLARRLASRRYARFAERWDAALTDLRREGDAAGDSVLAAANHAIRRRHRRIVRRIRKRHAWKSMNAVHELRKDCKKLRYLLEAFARLYPPRRHAKAVAELKRLQDELGRVCDLGARSDLIDRWRAAAGRGEVDPAHPEMLARLNAADSGAVPGETRKACRRFVSRDAVRRLRRLLEEAA